jgi:hypothetical protein
MQAGLEWQELLEIARPFAWMSLALALAAGYVSMIAKSSSKMPISGRVHRSSWNSA